MSVLSLAEASMPRVLLSAAGWFEQAVSGNAALLVATIAVGAIGFALFTGRLPVRQGLAALAGCFLLFGSAAIGRALRGLGGPVYAASEANSPPDSSLVTLPTVPPERDPYAGAGLVYPSGEPR